MHGIAPSQAWDRRPAQNRLGQTWPICAPKLSRFALQGVPDDGSATQPPPSVEFDFEPRVMGSTVTLFAFERHLLTNV